MATRLIRTLTCVTTGAERLLTWLDQTSPDPAADTVLPGWDIATLVAHLTTVIDTTTATLGRPSRSGAISVASHLASYRSTADQVAAREIERAARSGWPGIRDELRDSITALEAVSGDAVPAKVDGPGGTLRTEDWLATCMVELVTHADDLHRSVGGSAAVGFTRTERTLALRTLAQALGDNHPGHTIEVRVPPYTAVQCGIPGDGPTHTRGTPPNVVETDAPTFLRLATGRITWSQAIAGGTVSASGTRADLSTLLPLW